MPKKNDILENLNIDEEKLKLIKYYCAEKGEALELEKDLADIINKRIDNLYNKKVPKDVRHFLENQDKINNPAKVTAERKNSTLKESEVTINESERKGI